MRYYYAATLVVATLLSDQNAQAQATIDALTAARRHWSHQEYAAASTAYQQVLKRQFGTAHDYYRAAEAAARNQEPKAALRLLQQAVDKGYFAPEDIEAEESFTSLTAQPTWKRLVARARTKQQQHEAAFDPQLVALLKKIRYQDQHYRHLATLADKKYGPGSSEAAAADSRQNYFDLLTIRQIDSLLTQRGYPGKSLVGEYQKDVVFFVIQHSPDEKYLSLLTAAADKGEFDWSALALFIDRTRGARGEKQLYGSQLGPMINGHYTLDPIEDENNVNERRAKVGLDPLEEYLQLYYNLTYQVPTAAGNPNPPELYTSSQNEQREEKSDVELIGSYETLYASLRYPDAARQRNVSGHVTVQLTIDKDGVPKDVDVVQGLGHGCDEEAVRAMQAARYTNAAGEDHQIRVQLPFPYKVEVSKPEK